MANWLQVEFDNMVAKGDWERQASVSELPWESYRAPVVGAIDGHSIKGGDGFVGHIYGTADAEFVVRAVNTHATLVGLLRDVLDTDSWHLAGDLSDRIEAALDALSPSASVSKVQDSDSLASERKAKQ